MKDECIDPGEFVYTKMHSKLRILFPLFLLLKN